MINRSFTFLWLGKIISQLGDKFYAIALSWWILQKTNSAAIMGLFLLSSALPGILAGVFAGVLTDRWKRKTMLIVTDIIRGCMVLCISLLSMANVLEVWHVFVIAVSLSLATAFFDPAIQAIIPEIVEEGKLVKANSLSQMVNGVCTVVGPLFGAIAVGIFGLTWVFFANSISYFISSLLACFIISGNGYKGMREKASILKEMKEGISFIKNQKQIAFVLTVIAMTHLFMGGLTVTLPFLANLLQGNGINNLGYLQMMLGAGLLAGSLKLGLTKKTLINERRLITFMLALGFCLMVIATSQYFQIQTVYVYMLVMAVIGVLIAGAFIFWQSLLQRYTPGTMTGRVFSISTLVGNISLPAAYCLFGLLLNAKSMYILLGVSGVCMLVLSLCFYCRKSLNKTTNNY